MLSEIAGSHLLQFRFFGFALLVLLALFHRSTSSGVWRLGPLRTLSAAQKSENMKEGRQCSAVSGDDLAPLLANETVFMFSVKQRVSTCCRGLYME